MSRAGSAELRWTVPPEQEIIPNVERVEDGLADRIATAVTPVAQTMLSYARSNHPWQNQTGAAEAGLGVDVSVEGHTVRLTLFHGAPHGIWLEVRWGGRWGVIPMTMAANQGQIQSAIAQAIWP